MPKTVTIALGISLENQMYCEPAERQWGWSCFTNHKGHALLQDYHAWNSWRREACKYTVFLDFFCLWKSYVNIDYRPLHLLYLWFFKKFTFVDDLFNLNLWTSFHVTCSHFVMCRLPHYTYCYSFYLILWIATNFTLLYGVCLGFFHPFESEQVLL